MPLFEQHENTLSALFKDCTSRYEQIELICLATTDGFPVQVYSKPGLDVEADTISAASGTLFSVSNAISQQILKHPFRVSFIESEGANVAFVTIYGKDADFVLCMSASEELSIAHLRITINRLATEIAKLA
ncbi:roadblock/LC7 domain-containing protein [Parathalassolituus penaei]|uniref:Roadblock/LAMTOR2 domain-containing protein n=1 Tax=Parathalassolituus penaei TaxID=2997323 RepID=A0A9X3EG87_9GAMM|nr:hypothetical protein [Parathalassolituus penaei]MCY0966660.1 hypothetical protein [Parathalassolituus penaei]